ncbi:GTPase family protein [Salibacterium aidingense]|uniref:GTPase family protein n=1 Tax=Salibacterium aidingense TaxID=384933 RepID=UPI0004157B25|nr:GTPase [Salibacterium aidingense]
MNNEEAKTWFQEPIRLMRKKLLPKLPGPVKKQIEGEINRLEDIFLEYRSPRFAIVGRRGSGKSTFINAIFQAPAAEVGAVTSQTGRGQWHTFYTYDRKNASMDILDTRGLGEGSTPVETTNTPDSLTEVKQSLQDQCPDVFLFLVKAKEVDARITEDIQQLKELRTFVKHTHHYVPPVIGIVTQVDELDPVYDTEPPFEKEKRRNIDHASSHLEETLKDEIDGVIHVLPVCAYMAFKEEKVIYDRRWNMDETLHYLLNHLPGSTWLQWAKITQAREIQRSIAKSIGKSASLINGGLGAQPVPIADMPVITGVQISMITSIAYVSGRDLNRKSIMEFIGALGINVGAAYAFRQAARSLSKIVFPGAGHVVSGTVASIATWSLCKAAIAYFIDRQSASAVKTVFEQTKKDEELPPQ